MQLRRIEAKKATIVLGTLLAASNDTGVDVVLRWWQSTRRPPRWRLAITM